MRLYAFSVNFIQIIQYRLIENRSHQQKSSSVWQQFDVETVIET